MEYIDLRLSKAKYRALQELDPSLGRDPVANPLLRTWTYSALERFMLSSRDHEKGTTKSRLCYLRFLENHPVYPVPLHPPDEDAWLDHLAGRRQDGTLGPRTIRNYRHALTDLFVFLGAPRWASLDLVPREPRRTVVVIPDHLVPRFWEALPCPHRFTRQTLEHVAHLGFHTGLRPPGEICYLRLEDVEWDARCLVVRTPKKRLQVRVVDDLDRDVFTWLDRYITHVRPRSDAGRVFVTGDGRPVSPDGLRNRLAKAGKTLWPRFKPYSMRHWFITDFLSRHDSRDALTRASMVAGCSVDILMRHYVDHARVRARRRAVST